MDDKGYDKSGKTPRGAFTSYTSLVMYLAKLYYEVKHAKIKKRPPPPTRAKSRNRSKFCNYHKDYGHHTNECIHLKDEIGRLRDFVQ
jgi:hypothetical protein